VHIDISDSLKVDVVKKKPKAPFSAFGSRGFADCACVFTFSCIWLSFFV